MIYSGRFQTLTSQQSTTQVQTTTVPPGNISTFSLFFLIQKHIFCASFLAGNKHLRKCRVLCVSISHTISNCQGSSKSVNVNSWIIDRNTHVQSCMLLDHPSCFCWIFSMVIRKVKMILKKAKFVIRKVRIVVKMFRRVVKILNMVVSIVNSQDGCKAGKDNHQVGQDGCRDGYKDW